MGAVDRPMNIHFILDNGLYYLSSSLGVPRVGDEVRLTTDKFFTVTRVVWIYDEDHPRVNIGIIEAK